MSSPPDHDRADTLTRLASFAEELGANDVARDARQLAARVAEGRFFLATVGQVKRGKSTLLNALIGEPLLPVGVAPVTSAITVVRYGADKAARVIFKDGRTTPIPIGDVHTFVTEASNPENERAVAIVEIFHPAEADQPFVTTEPRYKTAAAAENDVIAIIASRANSSKA